jgi:hypothetical protein
MKMFKKKVNNLDKILDICLDRIIIGGESVEQCLKDYPQYLDELSSLLAVSVRTHKAMSSIEARPDFKSALRYDLTSRMNPVKATNQVKTSFRPSFKWQVQWAPAALSLCIVLLLSGGGTVAAAGNSMPNGPLYNVKLASEQVQLFFTFDSAGKANLCSEFVSERAHEIATMASANNVEAMNKSTSIMQEQLAMLNNLSLAGELSAFAQESGQAGSGVMTVTVTQTQWIDAEDATKHITRTEDTNVSPGNAVTVTETVTAGGVIYPLIGSGTATVSGQSVKNPPAYLKNDSNQELIDKLYDSIMILYNATFSNSGKVLEALLEAIAILESSYYDAAGNIN